MKISQRPGHFAAAIALAALFNLYAGPAAADPSASQTTAQKVVLAGGCFWGMEAVFESLKGVSSAVAGYSGGSKSAAHYEMVSTGLTGHAESVEITYDPSVITFGQLLGVYFLVAHDPTELDRQGPDEGNQYRSEIFYTTDDQRREADAYIHHLEDQHVFGSPIVTTLAQLQAFYPAEAYHQHFVQDHPDYPYVVINDLPKLAQLRKQFPQLVK
jgi:peptide-methionine (S)-S-oxide reductase